MFNSTKINCVNKKNFKDKMQENYAERNKDTLHLEQFKTSLVDSMNIAMTTFAKTFFKHFATTLNNTKV